MFVHLTLDGGSVAFLVLAFAATRSKMALRSVFFIRVKNCGPSVLFNSEEKIIDLYVEIEKSKIGLFQVSQILVY